MPITWNICGCTCGSCARNLEVDPDQPQFLITEPGVGYRLLADE